MPDTTFEELCATLRDEFGSAPVSSSEHPRMGDGDPVRGDLILRQEEPFTFAVGATERGQWVELGRFTSESEACAFVLDQVRRSRRPGKHPSAAETAESERTTQQATDDIRRLLGLADPAPTPLDAALTVYIWADGSAVPGRHPEAVSDTAIRAQVEGLIERMDAVTPGADATDLAAWADRTVRGFASERDDVGEAGIRALAALLSWTWR